MNFYPYTVYKFKMSFGDIDDVHERYVVATSEEEAIAKFEAYIKDLEKNGFAVPSGWWAYPQVEIGYVI